MSKKSPNIPADKLERYDALIVSHPEMERKGKNNPYTSVNGHMFSFMDKEGFISLRLPKGEREAFLERHNTQLSFQYNTVMKEYVVIPHELLMDEAKMTEYLQMSYDYVSSLKPKPSRKKK